jgi:hypothetical protein
MQDATRIVNVMNSAKLSVAEATPRIERIIAKIKPEGSGEAAARKIRERLLPLFMHSRMPRFSFDFSAWEAMADPNYWRQGFTTSFTQVKTRAARRAARDAE